MGKCSCHVLGEAQGNALRALRNYRGSDIQISAIRLMHGLVITRDRHALHHQSIEYPQIVQKDTIQKHMRQQAPAAALMVPLPPSQSNMLLSPENTVTICIFCHAPIKTAVKYTNNTNTHIAAALWCLTCCLCCVPYYCGSAKNSDHYCPNCKRYLGTYHKRMPRGNLKERQQKKKEGKQVGQYL